MHIRSYAKLNITLDVGPKQNNGLHTINSHMAKINFYDEFIIQNGTEFSLNCSNTLLELENNYISRAYSNFRKHIHIDKPPDITVKKNVPIGYGLGGGSSNYATTILGLVDLYKVQEQYLTSKKKILTRAMSDTSDSIFFLSEYTSAMVTGTGEQIKEIENPYQNEKVLIILPPFCTSTLHAYAILDTHHAINFSFLMYEPQYNCIVKILNKHIENYHITGTGSALWCLQKDIKNYKNFLSVLRDNSIQYIESEFL